MIAGLRGPDRDGISYAGTLDHDDYRALLRRTRVYVTAPRREDYGIAQLEALADGARVVTTPAPGPYAALPLLQAGLGWVSDPAPEPLSTAIRSALDDPTPDADLRRPRPLGDRPLPPRRGRHDDRGVPPPPPPRRPLSRARPRPGTRVLGRFSGAARRPGKSP